MTGQDKPVRDEGPEFMFYSGPWENSAFPTIVRRDPDGGDPHILCVIARVHNPEALYELCRRANAPLPDGEPLS